MGDKFDKLFYSLFGIAYLLKTAYNYSDNPAVARGDTELRDELFIPHSIIELYEKMIKEQFIGDLSLKDNWLIWRLPNGVIIKVDISMPWHEGYIVISYLVNKIEFPLNHWHPMEEDIYRDLYEINIGDTFWIVKRRTLFKKPPFNSFLAYFLNPPMMMYKSKWNRYSEKKKNRYIVL